MTRLRFPRRSMPYGAETRSRSRHPWPGARSPWWACIPTTSATAWPAAKSRPTRAPPHPPAGAAPLSQLPDLGAQTGAAVRLLDRGLPAVERPQGTRLAAGAHPQLDPDAHPLRDLRREAGRRDGHAMRPHGPERNPRQASGDPARGDLDLRLCTTDLRRLPIDANRARRRLRARPEPKTVPQCIGYATFLEREDRAFRRWFARLEKEIAEVASRPNRRLIEL
jgi:hypothetical protein